jgi:hypothetical protein
VGEDLLVFGIKHRQQDFLFEEEIRSRVEKGWLSLITAFSHEQEYRVFIQYKMMEEENSTKIWKMIMNGAHLYVCGDAKGMAAGLSLSLVLCSVSLSICLCLVGLCFSSFFLSTSDLMLILSPPSSLLSLFSLLLSSLHCPQVSKKL